MRHGLKKKTQQQRNNTSINFKKEDYEEINCTFQHDVFRHE